MHLFDVDIPNGPRLMESSATEKGNKSNLFDIFLFSSLILVVKVATTPLGELGLAICYDVRFPEQSQLLRRYGAQMICYPSAFTPLTGAAHWEVLLRARAIETQCYVIAPAQIGDHHSKRSSYGHGMIIDPWGRILAQCDPSKELDVVTADINLQELEKIRRNMPVFEHRRGDVYH